VAVGLALAGRAGSRLAASLGMAVSRSTLLRLIRGLLDPPVGRVTVLGVDEFALRRRHHYGTVLVDLTDGHRPVDVFIGREAGDFADWLRAHPGVEVICRDRAGAYADGARGGAPDAIQVADRWHLWDNLCQHVERLVAAHHACLPEPVVPSPDAPDPGAPVVPQWPSTMRIEHTRQRYDQTHELRERGLSMRAIARKLDFNFKTVCRYLRAGSVDSLLAGGVRVSVLDSFKPYLNERMAEGQRNATVLLGEIAERGYTGGYKTLARYLRPLRRVDAAALAALSPLPGRPAARQVTGWITGLPGHLDPADEERLHAIRARCPRVGRRRPPCRRLRPDDQGPVRRQEHAHRLDECRRRRPTDAAIVHRRAAPRPGRRGRRAHHALQLRRRRRHRQPHQTAQGGDVRTCETRPSAQADTPGLNIAPDSETTRPPR